MRRIAGRGYTGVVYDSVREVISELGGDPNADADYSTLQRVLVTPLLRRGLWVVLLDNVGHAEKGRPTGTGAKLDATLVASRRLAYGAASRSQVSLLRSQVTQRREAERVDRHWFCVDATRGADQPSRLPAV